MLFGTGAPLGHPQPIIEAISEIEMPEDLREEGLPELTDELKADLLGGNFARMLGLDVERLKKSFAEDEFAIRGEPSGSGRPAAVGPQARAHPAGA